MPSLLTGLSAILRNLQFATPLGQSLPFASLQHSLTSPSPVHRFSGSIADNEWLISPNFKALNPDKYFIVIPAMLGNGQSSSPSNSDLNPFPAT